MSVRLMVVEDDAHLGTGLTTLFRAAGDDATYVTTGPEALDRIASGTTDMLILDLDLPDLDGVEVCRRLRANGFNGGVLVMSARKEEL